MIAPKEAVQTLQPYSGPGEGRMENLRLDFNENVLGASPKVMEAIGKVTREEYGCYPEYKDLYRALSQFLNVPEDCVIASNGSDEAIKTIFDVYVDKGDEIILLSPSYSMYELFARVAGAKIIWVPYAADFSFPIDQVLHQISSKTRLIALASPNNPTGTFIQREDLIRIIRASPNMAVLIDEAYALYAQETNIDLATTYPNVFVTQTFSKGHGLAGLRIGYLISQKQNIEAISKVLSPSYSVDCLAASAAMAAMADPDYVSTYVEEILSAREFFIEQLEMLGIKTVPSKANFVLAHFGEEAQKVKQRLAEKKILVRERPDLEGYLRFTIGTEKQMKKVLSILNPLCKAIIFDMDGVLIDESQSYRTCIAKTAAFFLKTKIDPNLVESLKAKGGYNNDYDCTEAILSLSGCKVSREEVALQFDTYYEELKDKETWLLDEKLLQRLKEKYRLAIFTGRPRKDALDALQRFDKTSFFELVIADDDVKARKPNPEGLLLSLEQLGVSQAIYIGDSKDDAEAARRASVDFIGVVPPGGTAENLKQAGALIILEDINSLEDFL